MVLVSKIRENEVALFLDVTMGFKNSYDDAARAAQRLDEMKHVKLFMLIKTSRSILCCHYYARLKIPYN